ncbi:MAG: hypothetical protein HZA88_03010 [Verrucomicrobia bacterium]|nr:hypothetical protein [Verrucomicrobiota bacterium]
MMFRPYFKTLVFASALLYFARSASAFIVVGNMDINDALHWKSLAVAGRVVERDMRRKHDAEQVPSRITFEIESVIFGPATLKGSRIEVFSSGFFWPEVLVPLKDGAFCILLFPDRYHPSPSSSNYVMGSVVPAHQRVFSPVQTPNEAIRVLAHEILDELADEKSENRQRHLIMQLGPILSVEDVRRVSPFLESKNIWVKRAALAAVLYATGDKSYMQMAADDIGGFLKGTLPTDQLSFNMEPWGSSGTERAYRQLFRHYFFFERKFEGNKKCARLVPIYRVVAKEPNCNERYRWSFGILPLIWYGNQDDGLILYKCLLDAYPANQRTFSQDRRKLILAIARKLKLGIENHKSMGRFLQSDDELLTIVRDALIERGIIEDDKIAH